MPTVKVRNLKNKEVGDVELLDAIFGVELNESLIHSAVMNYQANGRQGTSATKTRGNVSGSGRKLWKQKGTGRARIASLRSPLWKGGGNVHGPQPRDWSYQMPKKMRRGALRSALSERLREGNLIVIDGFEFNNPKTSEFLAAIGTLGLSENKKKPTKTLIIDSLDNLNLILSSRNVAKTKVTNSFGLNIYDIIYHEKLLISKSALEELTSLLAPKRESEKAAGAEASEKKPKAGKETDTAKTKALKDVDDAVTDKDLEESKAKTDRAAKKAGEEKAVDTPKTKKEPKPKSEKTLKKEAAAKNEADKNASADEAPAKATEAPADKAESKEEAADNE